jgi:hypothetical protein
MFGIIVRSVLYVIDEAPHTKHVGSVSPFNAVDVVVAENDPSGPGAQDFSVSWTSFPVGDHPRSESQDTTPQQTIIRPTSSLLVHPNSKDTRHCMSFYLSVRFCRDGASLLASTTSKSSAYPQHHSSATAHPPELQCPPSLYP